MTKTNALEVIQKDITPIVSQASTLEISTPKEMESGVELLSKLNKFSDKITEEKEKITKPLNEALKVERARWKPLETLYEEAIAVVRRKMTNYQTEVKRLEKIEEDKIASRIGEGKGKLKIETAVKKMDAIEKADTNVSTASGSVKFRPVKKFEVVDIKLLPLQYHVADEVAIRKAMVAGIEVKGVRYYEEQVPFNSR